MSIKLIEFVNVATVDDFFAQLEGQLDLDYELERNLDALYDALSNEIDGPTELVWHDSIFSRTALGDWFVRIIDVLNIAIAEGDGLSVSLQ